VPHLWKHRSKQPSHTAYAGGFFFPVMTEDVSKQSLREQLLAARLRLTPADRSTRSRAACERLVALDAFRNARTVGLYAAIGAETDPATAAREALSSGKRLAFPRLEPDTRRLAFFACAPEDLVASARGTRAPPAEAPPVALEELDLVVVPGVAFDTAGRRLGRGGGYYDATLAAVPPGAARVGLAFDLQLVPFVPGEPHDAEVHAVVTEQRVVHAPASRLTAVASTAPMRVP
jgi:5-formyltetrahydrofolate cyclo-ligase